MPLFRHLSLGLVAMLFAAASYLTAAPPLRARDADQPDRGPAVRTLQAKLEAMDWYGPADALNLRFSLHNPTSESVWVLRWLLPSDELDANLFTVRRNGEPVPYHGILAKRAPNTVEDWVEVKAGETFAVLFDPSASYDMTGRGQYTLEYRVHQLGVRHKRPQPAMEAAMSLGANKGVDSEPHGRAPVTAARAELYFDGLPVDALTKAPEMPVVGGYSKCTTSQQGTLATAHDHAEHISSLATNAVGSGTFTKWFGTSSASNIKPHYVAIHDAFATKSVVYDCSCKKQYYAYVYANQPYKIYVCRAFWSAPMLGRDSKAGTLVHEMSHFNVTVGTQDYVYGATGAANLAITDPAKAAMNADNHEYFAEDQKMQ